jgi:DNA repair exonuclease SbcCD nuclease subunit
MTEQSIECHSREVLIADPHLHPFTRHSSHPDGNRWVEEGLNAMKEAYRHAIEISATRVVILGDLFNTGVRIDTDLFCRVVNFFRTYQYDIKTVLIAGNHDQSYPGSSNTPVAGLGEFCHCITEPEIRTGKGVKSVFLPYTEDPYAYFKKLEEDGDGIDWSEYVLYAHLAIEGATTGPMSYVPKSSVKNLPDFKGIYMGHYHKRQTLLEGRAQYVGSLRQLNHGETNDGPKGFTVLHHNSDGTLTSELIPITNTTTFVTVKDKPEEDCTGKIVRVECYGPHSETEIKESTVGAVGVEIIQRNIDMKAARVESDGEESLTDTDYVNHFIKGNALGYNKPKLRDIGINLLKES